MMIWDAMYPQSLDPIINAYFDSLGHHRRCVHQAGQEACQSLFQACAPDLDVQGAAFEQRFDQAVLASVTLLQVNADGQRQLQRVAEKWFSTLYSAWLDPWRQQDSPFSRALQIGDVSCGSLAKVSRQVGHFAVTRWSAAAMHATHDARRAWRLHCPR
jgi:hypothetical protein